MNRVHPMLAKLAPKPWNDKNVLWEAKYNGFRAIVDTASGTIQSRPGKDKTANFPDIKPETKKPAVLDGELVTYKDGIPNFDSIQRRTTDKDIEERMEEYPAHYEVFDVLEIDKISVENLPLKTRKKLLAAVLIPSKNIHLAPFVIGDGEGMFQKSLEEGQEGVIGKQLDQPYIQGMRGWVKVKRTQFETFTVVAYTPGVGRRYHYFGALSLAKATDEGLQYVGEVGTGFNDQNTEEVFSLLKSTYYEHFLKINPYPTNSQPIWVLPVTRVVIKYLEYTNAGILRFPVYVGVDRNELSS